jgi:hypothetical protein
MKKMLLAAAGLCAVLAVPAAPAGAEPGDQAFVAQPAVTADGDARRFVDRFDRRRLRGNADTLVVYDRDWQGDSAWRADSFNDWWHDRPDRSMPRWVRHNQNCERMYWSGGGWRC